MNVEITPMVAGVATIGLDGIPVGTLEWIPSGVPDKRGYYVTNGLIALAGRSWPDEETARQDIIQYIDEGTLPGDSDETAGSNPNPPLCSAEEAEGGTTDHLLAPARVYQERQSRLIAENERLKATVAGLLEVLDECAEVFSKDYGLIDSACVVVDCDDDGNEIILAQRVSDVINKARGETA